MTFMIYAWCMPWSMKAWTFCVLPPSELPFFCAMTTSKFTLGSVHCLSRWYNCLFGSQAEKSWGLPGSAVEVVFPHVLSCIEIDEDLLDLRWNRKRIDTMGIRLFATLHRLFADIRCFLFAHSVQSWHSGQAWLSVERVLYLLLHLPLLLIAPAMYLQIATVFAWTENCTTPSKKAPALRAFFFDVHKSHNTDSRILEFKATTRCKSVMKCTHDRIYHLDRRVMPMDVTSL